VSQNQKPSKEIREWREHVDLSYHVLAATVTSEKKWAHKADAIQTMDKKHWHYNPRSWEA